MVGDTQVFAASGTLWINITQEEAEHLKYVDCFLF